LPNPAIIGPPDPAAIAGIPPPRETAEEEAIAEKIIEAAIIKVGVMDFESGVNKEVEEVVEEVVLIEAMVKVGAMDEVESIDEVIIQVVRS
jgi:hypothetical protein